MTLKQKKILECLSKSPLGLRAAEIADKLNITRREVNQFLYYEQTDYVITVDYRWVSAVQKISEQLDVIERKISLLEEISKKDVVLSKLNNCKNAKVFTSRHFNSLADWSICKSHSDKPPVGVHKTKNNNLYEYNSKSELKLLKHLDSNKTVVEIGGQNLCILYDTAFRESASYYPDFVILKSDGHIAIIEVKSLVAMSNHSNVEKYKTLKAYCIARGYEYMMVDPDKNYMTFDDLEKMRIPREIIDRVECYLQNLLGKKREYLLEKEDIPILYEPFSGNYKKGEFELYLHALVIQKDWYNKYKHGFMVYETPKK